MYGVGMVSKDIIFMSNSVKIGLLLQKLKWGRQTRTHTSKNNLTSLHFFFVRKKVGTTWNLCNLNIIPLIIKYVLEVIRCNLDQVFIKLFHILIFSLLVISCQIFRSYVMSHRSSESIKSVTQTEACYDGWAWNCQYASQSQMLDISILIQKGCLAITRTYHVRGRAVLVPNCSDHSSPSVLNLILKKSSSKLFELTVPTVLLC